ncbi:PhzF family phenazine biosynthesis protein [Lewinella sp. LCG006]|uniref:PhzF family phenazine biosynthesis protein n=1 Tax=Lewinella sp. LCG006 TaxID=3231911 RepID=UPI003460FE21
MVLRIYQVDAFHHELLRGNPAAVIPLDKWLSDEKLQAIAGENNLSETAFFLPEENGAIPLRWFTPNKEVRLCGHATLASAHVLFQEIGLTGKIIRFSSLSGILEVERLEKGYRLNFPADEGTPVSIPSNLESALGVSIKEAILGNDDLLIITDSQAQIAGMAPDFNALQEYDVRGIIVSAPGDEVDFVSRCFYPRFGINEDPVTGSAHTLMTPYWAKKLGKSLMEAHQISPRKGILRCTLQGDRVLLEGQASTYLRGQIFL